MGAQDGTIGFDPQPFRVVVFESLCDGEGNPKGNLRPFSFGVPNQNDTSIVMLWGSHTDVVKGNSPRVPFADAPASVNPIRKN